MDLEVVHNSEEPEEVVEGRKLPLHKDPEYLAALKELIVAQHNKKFNKASAIAKTKAPAGNRGLGINSAAR